MQQESYSLRYYPSQLTKRKRELIGKHKVSDIFTVITSPAVARILNIFSKSSSQSSAQNVHHHKQLFIKIKEINHDDEKEELVFKLYIDPSLGLLKSNFKSESVDKELYMNEIAMRKFKFTEGTKLEIVKIGLKSEIDKIQRIILTPHFEGGSEKIVNLNKNCRYSMNLWI